jgi:hypothetical protein
MTLELADFKLEVIGCLIELLFVEFSEMAVLS